MKCKRCRRKLHKTNRSGYCTKCYTHSPQYLEYQRKKQKEWYIKKENKLKKKIYLSKPKIKRRIKKYQKKYQRENKARMRKLKRNWARKNRK